MARPEFGLRGAQLQALLDRAQSRGGDASLAASLRCSRTGSTLRSSLLAASPHRHGTARSVGCDSYLRANPAANPTGSRANPTAREPDRKGANPTGRAGRANPTGSGANPTGSNRNRRRHSPRANPTGSNRARTRARTRPRTRPEVIRGEPPRREPDRKGANPTGREPDRK